MRQVWIERAGPPEVLTLREVEEPKPAAGELRIRVEAAGVNFGDIMGRLGTYPALPIPCVPGFEVGGKTGSRLLTAPQLPRLNRWCRDLAKSTF